MKKTEGIDPISAQGEPDKREAILLVAATLFARKGYAGTPVREIVEAAGVTKPTLYYYFKNKEDLYLQLISTAVNTFTDLLERSKAQDGSMRERLLWLFENCFQLFACHADLLRLINAAFYGPRGAAPAYDFQAVLELHYRVVEEILRQGVAEGELEETHLGHVQLLLMGLFESLQVHVVAPPFSWTLTVEDIRQSVRLIFEGVKGVPFSRQGVIHPCEKSF